MKTASLGAFKQVLLQDGTSFAVHKAGRSVSEGSRPLARRQSSVICSCLYWSKVQFACRSLPIRRQSASSCLSERLNNSPLLADAGYIDMAYFAKLNEAGGFYLVRGKSLNPKIIRAWRGDERKCRSWRACQKDAGRRHCRAEVLDMVVKSGKFEYRLIRRWFAEEKRFCIWMTNLPREAWPAERVMSLYRCRWQVELLFKEWKSHNRLKGFVTGQKAIAEGVWASLLSLVMKRRVAQTLMGTVYPH